MLSCLAQKRMEFIFDSSGYTLNTSNHGSGKMISLKLKVEFQTHVKIDTTDNHIFHGILRFIIVNGAKCSWQGCICFARCNKKLTLQRNIATAD